MPEERANRHNFMHSIRRLISNEAGIKRMWEQALKEATSARTLEGLREVQRSLQKNPAAYAHLYLAFLKDFLAPQRVHELTDDDLRAVEALGQMLVDEADLECSTEQVWYCLAEAYERRGETRRSQELLVRVYQRPMVSEQVKQQAVRALVRLGSQEETHLAVYRDYVRHTSDPADKALIGSYLTSISKVDFDAPPTQLKRAHDIVCSRWEGIEFPEQETICGLYAFHVESNYAQAVVHFQNALRSDKRNALAQKGLLTALIRQGNYSRVLAQQIDEATEPVVKALKSLLLALNWLEDAQSVGEPPFRAQDLAGSDLSKYVGEIADLTLGRLYLLEGNVEQAASVLHALTERSSHPRHMYYDAWASLLNNDSDRVAHHFRAIQPEAGNWTIACLLLECNPGELKDKEIQRLLETLPSAYNPIFIARVDLARGEAPPEIAFASGPGTLEEEMEQFRTVLGVSFYRGDTARMQQAIQLPLFHHLPYPDRLLWRGQSALLAKEEAEAERLLDEAANSYRHQRAASLLAVHRLRRAQHGGVKPLLDIAAQGHLGQKVALLRSYLEHYDGPGERAAEEIAEVIASQDGRACYAQGKLCLHWADMALKEGRRDQCQFYRQQALQCFTRAETLDGAPADSHVLARCAALISDPEQDITPFLDLWDEVEGLDSAAQQPWLLWYALLVCLWSNRPELVATACEKLPELLAETEHLEDHVTLALAQIVAATCSQTKESDQAMRMVDLLGDLLDRSGSAEVAQLHRQCFTIYILLLYICLPTDMRRQVQQVAEQAAKDVPTNGSLAVLLALIYLQNKEPERAVALLKDMRPEQPFEQRVCGLLAALFSKEQPSEALLQSVATETPEQARLCQVLVTATAFATGRREAGVEGLLMALCPPLDVVASTGVDIRRSLDYLCAYLLKTGKVPADLVDIVLNGAAYLADERMTMRLARILAAIGEVTPALLLWERLAEGGDATFRQELVEFLCYGAAQAYKRGDVGEATQRLRDAIRIGGQEQVRGLNIAQLVQELEGETAIQRLLSVCIPGYIELDYTPGRYHFLKTLIEKNPQLRQALLKGTGEQVAYRWRLVMRQPRTLQEQAQLLHGLAVIALECAQRKAQTEEPLWLFGTALWVLLLCSKEFWQYFLRLPINPDTGEASPLNEAEQQQLMDDALQRVLSLHITSANRAFTSGRHIDAGIHLSCLRYCAQGTERLQRAVRDREIFFQFRLDTQRVEMVKERAEKLLNDWCDQLVKDAQFALHDKEAIDRLPKGIQKNYEGALGMLENFPHAYVSSKRLLRSCLGWYNDWCEDLFQLATTDDRLLAAVVKSASSIADLLVPLCKKDQASMYLPENQELAQHFTYRALVSHEIWQGIRACREALLWDQYASRANGWLNFFQYLDKLAKLLRDVKDLRERRMLSAKGKWYLSDLRRSYEKRGADLRFMDILEAKGSMSTSLLVLHNLMHPDPKKKDAQVPVPSSLMQGELSGLSDVASPKNEGDEVETFIKRGLLALRAKRFEEAEARLRHALRISRDAEQQAEINKHLAVAYNAHGEHLMTSIRLHRTRGETPLPALMRDAHHCFEDALTYDPDNPEPRQNLEILQRLS